MSKIISLVGWVFTAIFCAALLFFSFSGLFTTVVVSGDSMYPTYNSGDLVITQKQSEYAVGEVIVYHPEVDCSRCNVVHRIIGGDSGGWITQGDNNDFIDPFRPTSESIHGEVIQHFNMGGIGMFLFNTQLWFFLFTLFALVLYSLYFWDWIKDSFSKDDELDDEPDKPEEKKKEPRHKVQKEKKASPKLLQFGSAGSSAIVALLSLSLVASAAPTLALNATTLTNSKQVSCSTASLSVGTVSSSDNHLRVINIPAACNGQTLIVRTLAPTSANAIQSSSTIAGTTLNLPGATLADPSAVTGARVTIAGFALPATWSWTNNNPDPINPTPGDYTVAVVYTQPNAQQICANITVTTTSATLIPWHASLRTTGVPFNGDTNSANYQFNPNSSYRFVSNTAVNGIFTIEGIGASANVSSSASRSFTVCNYSVPFPSGREPGVTYTVSPGNGTNYTVAPGWYVCQTFTVTTSGATQFYVGWDATIDATPLYNAYNAQSGQTGSFTPPTGGFTTQSLGGNLYKIAGNDWATAGIKDGTQQQFSACWGG